jgi:hypothetical protein
MMMDFFDLRFTAGASVLAGCAIGVMTYVLCQVFARRPVQWADAPGAVPDRLSLVDGDAPDPLFENSLVGYIRQKGPDGQILWYSTRTRASMAVGLQIDDPMLDRQIKHYARMTASTAFELHPELREPASRPLRLCKPGLFGYQHRPRVH